MIRRLDHVAVLVRDTDEAMNSYCGRAGLAFVSSETVLKLRVRLTYLDLGNAFLQLLEPLDGESEAGRALESNGEGLHHICFGVDDVERSCRVLGCLEDGDDLAAATGRGRVSAFVPGWRPSGVRIECTECFESQDSDMTLLPPTLY